MNKNCYFLISEEEILIKEGAGGMEVVINE